MEYEWGPWVNHNHKQIPKEVYGKYVSIISLFDDGRKEYIEGVLPDHTHHAWLGDARLCWLGGSEECAPVIQYRIRRPLVKKWLQSIDIKEPVDA